MDGNTYDGPGPHDIKKKRRSEGTDGVVPRVLFNPINFPPSTSGTKPSNRTKGPSDGHAEYAFSNKSSKSSSNWNVLRHSSSTNKCDVNNFQVQRPRNVPLKNTDDIMKVPPPCQSSNGNMVNQAQKPLERISSKSRFAPPHAQQGSNSTFAVPNNTASSSSSYESHPIDQLECKTKENSVKEKTKMSASARKKLREEIRNLDNTNHCQLEEFSCSLCSIIVPDRETMIRHSESLMHLRRLLKCWMESLEKAKEEMKNAEDYESDSSSSEYSDDVPPKKQRVQWNLKDDV